MNSRNWQAHYKVQPRYVLLDRDGVLNRRISPGYVTCWEQFEFLPRALAGLRLLAENGYIALVVSNQACVAKRLLSPQDLDSITRRFLLEAALAGGNIAHVYYCPHREEDHCACRKPSTGLLEKAWQEYTFIPEKTFLVGDSFSDLEAADTFGCPSILIRREAFLEANEYNDPACPVASDLYDAAEMIVELQAVKTSEPALARQ
jgi:D-glycero-D-manno-heptose 1,7-bisphosphate phosphatase